MSGYNQVDELHSPVRVVWHFCSIVYLYLYLHLYLCLYLYLYLYLCLYFFLHFYSLAALWLCLARASWFAEGPTLCWLYPTLYWSQTIMQLAAKMTMKSSGGDNNDGDHGSVDSREGYWSWTMPSTGNTVAPWNKRQTLPFGQHSLFQHQLGGFLWISLDFFCGLFFDWWSPSILNKTAHTPFQPVKHDAGWESSVCGRSFHRPAILRKFTCHRTLSLGFLALLSLLQPLWRQVAGGWAQLKKSG